MNRSAVIHWILTALLMALGLAGPSPVWSAETDSDYTEEDCIQCHRTGSEESELHISVEEFRASAHNEEATCQDCHEGVTDDAHQDEEGSGAVDCTGCHDQENRHGPEAETKERPQCHDCHTRHNILAKTDPASSVHRSRLPVTCAGCHPVASGQRNYFSWFPGFQIASHNKADFSFAYEEENCLGCHQGAGAHGETEPIDEQTCYKCHSSESDGALWGRMHPDASRQSQPSVFAAGVIYQVFIGVALIMIVGRFFRKRSSSGSISN